MKPREHRVSRRRGCGGMLTHPIAGPPLAVSYDVTLRSLVLQAHHPVHSRDVTIA